MNKRSGSTLSKTGPRCDGSGWRAGVCAGVAAASMLMAQAGRAGDGTDVVLVIDPTDPVSLRVGHYYQQARGVPSNHVIYMPIATSPYESFRQFQLRAVQAKVDQLDLDLTVDYIVLAPSTVFANFVPGIFEDPCAPVFRFSITSAYSSVYLQDEFSSGPVSSLFANPWGRVSSTIVAPFDGLSTYRAGVPSATGDRLLIASSLGYTGELGNTVDEILTMIDRSVAAEGSLPNGTTYLMQTTDVARSGPRQNTFAGVVSDIQAAGGQAEVLQANLPIGRDDAIGVLSGFASTNVDQADFTLLPGAIAEHLTSFAATFDNTQQTKISQWVRKGASGTFGTVQEPCNYAQKFPHARVHAYYWEGMPLGAAIFRSLAAYPIQGLMVGDPLTQPFDLAPTVQLSKSGGGGSPLTLTMATTGNNPGVPDPFVGRLFIGGVEQGLLFNNSPTPINTSGLSDGWHEAIVAVRDTSPVQSTASGRIGFEVSNLGRAAEVLAADSVVTLDEMVQIEARILGPDGASELRIIQNDRVVAAAAGSQALFSVPAGLLGEGTSQWQLEALFADGMRVRSAPESVEVLPGMVNSMPEAPEASFVSVLLTPGLDALVELPFSTDGALEDLTFEVLNAPAQAGLNVGAGGASVMLAPNAAASGLDRLTYRVTGPGGSSEGWIRLSYDGVWPEDLDGDGGVTSDDLRAFVQSPVDLNGDGIADDADRRVLEAMVRAELPVRR